MTEVIGYKWVPGGVVEYLHVKKRYRAADNVEAMRLFWLEHPDYAVAFVRPAESIEK